jgi:hypothetical protein
MCGGFPINANVHRLQKKFALFRKLLIVQLLDSFPVGHQWKNALQSAVPSAEEDSFASIANFAFSIPFRHPFQALLFE